MIEALAAELPRPGSVPVLPEGRAILLEKQLTDSDRARPSFDHRNKRLAD